MLIGGECYDIDWAQFRSLQFLETIQVLT